MNRDKMTHLQIDTLGATELLQIEVQHDSHPSRHLWTQKWLLDLLGEVVEGGDCLRGEGEVGATLTLILSQLVQPGLPQLLQEGTQGSHALTEH